MARALPRRASGKSTPFFYSSDTDFKLLTHLGEVINDELDKSYHWDYVLVLPATAQFNPRKPVTVKSSGSATTPSYAEQTGRPLLTDKEEFTVEHFIEHFLGISLEDQMEKEAGKEIQIHKRDVVLKDERCFLGEHNDVIVRKLAASDKYPRADLETRIQCLEAEYLRFVTQDIRVREPSLRTALSASDYAHLILRAVVDRLQLTCGLTCEVFWSLNKEDFIVSVRADELDLAIEADRLNYPLQLRNKPFDKGHKDFLELCKQSVGVKEFDDWKNKLYTARGGLAEEPELDPHLFCSGKDNHPMLIRQLKVLGHDERIDAGPYCVYSDTTVRNKYSLFQRLWIYHTCTSPGEAAYVAPYSEYHLSHDVQPLFRRYPVQWQPRKRRSSVRASRERDTTGSSERLSGTRKFTLFTPADRLTLVDSIIRRHLRIAALEKKELIRAYFPLHDPLMVENFEKSWIWTWRGVLSAPINSIKDYFGKRIALYFSLREFYFRFLLFPALPGLVVFFVDQYAEFEFSSWLLLALAGLVIFWSMMFLLFWRRKHQILDLLWGTTKMEEGTSEILQMARPNFTGIVTMNPVTDEGIAWYAKYHVHRKRQILVSIVLGAFCIATAAIQIILITALGQDFTANFDLDGYDVHLSLSIGVGVITGLQIAICKAIYTALALYFNELENYRTQSSHENALAQKIFFFDFVANFTTPFYSGFYGCLDADDKEECFSQLGAQVGSVFITGQVIKTVIKIGVPYMTWAFNVVWQRYSRRKQPMLKGPINQSELQYALKTYNELDLIIDFTQLILSFGYVTMFVVTNPLLPLLAMVASLVDKHVDGFKLCGRLQRPQPSPGTDIGPYLVFFEIISFIGIFTNTALVLFISETPLLLSMSDGDKLLTLILVQNGILVLRYLVFSGVGTQRRTMTWLAARFRHTADVVIKGLRVVDNSRLPSEFSEKYHFEIAENPALLSPVGPKVPQGSDLYQSDV